MNSKKQYRNKKFRKFNKRKRISSITTHRYLIRTHFKLNQVYTQQNISLDIGNELFSNNIFQNLCKVYQYFKLANVRLDFTPVTLNGSQPPVGHVIFVGNDAKAPYVLYSSVPELSYAKKINNIKPVSYFFTRPGRQNDFNYWNDTTVSNYSITAYFKMHFENTFEDGKGYYMARISYDLRFDRPFVSSVGNKKEAEEKVEIHKKEGNLIDKDEEAFNQAFSEIPSEDDANQV